MLSIKKVFLVGLLCGTVIFSKLTVGRVACVYAAPDFFLKTKIEKIPSQNTTNLNKINQVLRNFYIPEDIGVVKEVHVPKTPNDQLVITIQDMHCHYQAQINIAKIIDYLMTTFGVKFISVEGGFGKIDTSFYRKLPNKRIKNQVADYFLQEARINGTEFFAITTDKDIVLYGAEDAKYYDKNLDAFLRVLPERDNILKKIDSLENTLNILKKKIYNKELQELDDHIVAYENDVLSFEEYILFISEYYSDEQLHRDFEELWQLVSSVKLKKQLDHSLAEEQRKEAIVFMTNYLARVDLETLLRSTMEFKAHKMNKLEYHNQLRSLYFRVDDKFKEGLFSEKWPQLYLYTEYLNRYETLNNFLLFDQIDKYIERIKNRLYTSYTQKKLDYSFRSVRLVRNLFMTKLLHRDLIQIEKNEDIFNEDKLVNFIKKQAKRLKLSLSIPHGLYDIKKNLPVVMDFYRYASKRNDVLSGNTLKNMRDEGENIGILVSGGFHTEGIIDNLKEKRISNIVIIPRIDELAQDDTRYINALKGKCSLMETMVEGKSLSLRDKYFSGSEAEKNPR